MLRIFRHTIRLLAFFPRQRGQKIAQKLRNPAFFQRKYSVRTLADFRCIRRGHKISRNFGIIPIFCQLMIVQRWCICTLYAQPHLASLAQRPTGASLCHKRQSPNKHELYGKQIPTKLHRYEVTTVISGAISYCILSYCV